MPSQTVLVILSITVSADEQTVSLPHQRALCLQHLKDDMW